MIYHQYPQQIQAQPQGQGAVTVQQQPVSNSGYYFFLYPDATTTQMNTYGNMYHQ